MNQDSPQPQQKITDVAWQPNSPSNRSRDFAIQSRPMLSNQLPSSASHRVPIKSITIEPTGLSGIEKAESTEDITPIDPVLNPIDGQHEQPIMPAAAALMSTPLEAPLITQPLEPEKPASKPTAPEATTNETNTSIVTANISVDKVYTDPEKEKEEMAQTIKRERELQKYINSRQFFLPVNASARKHSVKVTIGLVLVSLLLGIILIDLLLDNGTILSSHAIPHTHFFTTVSPS